MVGERVVKEIDLTEVLRWVSEGNLTVLRCDPDVWCTVCIRRCIWCGCCCPPDIWRWMVLMWQWWSRCHVLGVAVGVVRSLSPVVMSQISCTVGSSLWLWLEGVGINGLMSSRLCVSWDCIPWCKCSVPVPCTHAATALSLLVRGFAFFGLGLISGFSCPLTSLSLPCWPEETLVYYNMYVPVDIIVS